MNITFSRPLKFDNLASLGYGYGYVHSKRKLQIIHKNSFPKPERKSDLQSEKKNTPILNWITSHSNKKQKTHVQSALSMHPRNHVFSVCTLEKLHLALLVALFFRLHVVCSVSYTNTHKPSQSKEFPTTRSRALFSLVGSLESIKALSRFKA